MTTEYIENLMFAKKKVGCPRIRLEKFLEIIYVNAYNHFFISSFDISSRCSESYIFLSFFFFVCRKPKAKESNPEKRRVFQRIPKAAEFRSATSSAIRNDACTSFVLLAFARPPPEYVNSRI